MHHDSKAALLINDLDSIAIMIEDLPPHPHYTRAGDLIREAKAEIANGRAAVHQKELHDRYDV